MFRANAKGDVNIESTEISSGLQYVLNRSYLAVRYENGKPVPSEDSDGIQDSAIAFRHVAMWYPVLKTKQTIEPDDLKVIQEVYVIGTAQDKKTVYDSLLGVERIGVNFDFDIRSIDADAHLSEPPKFRGIATLKSPQAEIQDGAVPAFEPFRSAAIRFPWVYVQTRANGKRKAQLFVYRLPTDKTDAGEMKPLQAVDDVGDGYCMVRWDNVLLCTRNGGLEVYSLVDPNKPRRLSHCEPTSKKTASPPPLCEAATERLSSATIFCCAMTSAIWRSRNA